MKQLKKYFSTYYWLETGELGTVLVIAGHPMMTVSGSRLVSASLRGSGNDAATSYYRIMAPPTDQKHNPAFWSQGKLWQWMISLRQDSTLVTLAMENVDTDLVRVKIVGNRLSEINFRMKKKGLNLPFMVFVEMQWTLWNCDSSSVTHTVTQCLIARCF